MFYLFVQENLIGATALTNLMFVEVQIYALPQKNNCRGSGQVKGTLNYPNQYIMAG